MLFLLFAIAVMVWLALHVAASVRALGKLQAEPPMEIDMGFVRVPDYYAREVREGRTMARLIVSPLRRSTADVGPVMCESDCVLERQTQHAAVVATGTLRVGESVKVDQFADSSGEMSIASGAAIGGPVTSQAAIRLGRNVSVVSAHAPEITTEAGSGVTAAAQTGSTSLVKLQESRIGGRVRQMSEDTWIHEGDLVLQEPMLVAGKLIVRGGFTAAAGTVLQDDVKATGDIQVGSGSVCKGSLVADGNIDIGPGTRFERAVYAAGTLKVRSGARGEGPAPVAAFARSTVFLEDGILIRGRVSSEKTVVTA